MTKTARRDGLWLFFFLTFAWTWGLGALFAFAPEAVVAISGEPSGSNPLFILAVWAPTIVALLVAAITGGRAGLIDLLSRLVRWRVAWLWYALATFGVAAIALAAQFASGAETVDSMANKNWPVLVTLGLTAFVIDPGPFAEELGWRGYALPRLEQRWNGLISALVLGAIWGVWHLPAFFIAGLPQASIPIWAFMLSTISVSVLMTWIVNNASGSVILAILTHWAINRFQALDATSAPYTAIAFAIAALLVIVFAGAKLAAERMPAPPSK